MTLNCFDFNQKQERQNITNNTNVTNSNNSQSQTAKPEAEAKPQAAVTKPAAAPVVKEKKSLWQRLRPTGVEAMILLIIVALLLLVLNDWYITNHLNDVIKVVNDIQIELAKPWYQFW